MFAVTTLIARALLLQLLCSCNIVDNVCAMRLNCAVFFCRREQVYENVTFGGTEHLRIADEEGMFERTVTLCSASKLFSLTGGYL